MAYCPEDGTKMECVNSSVSFAEYRCPRCGTHWQYDAENGLYMVIEPLVLTAFGGDNGGAGKGETRR